MEFSAPESGLYMFAVTASTKSLQLMKGAEVVADMTSDIGRSNTLVSTMLTKDQVVKTSSASVDDLSFLGLGLHLTTGVQGTSAAPLDVENTKQTIKMTDYQVEGSALTYEDSGQVCVKDVGTFLISLTLGSKDTSYASLSIADRTLGLGTSSDGQNMMANSAIMQLNIGDCIKPQLEPLSQILEEGRWSQLLVFPVPEGSSSAFSYALSLPVWNKAKEPVLFDVPLLAHDSFSSTTGEFSVSTEEEFNPRRFFLVLVHAFMSAEPGNQDSGLLELQRWDGSQWEVVGEVQASTDRTMVSIITIVQMDNTKYKLRVAGSGLLDEGDYRFATFSACEIGM